MLNGSIYTKTMKRLTDNTDKLDSSIERMDMLLSRIDPKLLASLEEQLYGKLYISQPS